MSNVHASAVLVGELGVLIRGPSGSGKSSLVLALLAAAPETTWLIADDRVEVVAADGRLVAFAPAAIAGRMEIRGQGVVAESHVSPARIHLIVDLQIAPEADRFPDGTARNTVVEGIGLPRLALPAGLADGALRVRAALARVER